VTLAAEQALLAVSTLDGKEVKRTKHDNVLECVTLSGNGFFTTPGVESTAVATKSTVPTAIVSQCLGDGTRDVADRLTCQQVATVLQSHAQVVLQPAVNHLTSMMIGSSSTSSSS
jgi:hypothetical protein